MNTIKYYGENKKPVFDSRVLYKLKPESPAGHWYCCVGSTGCGYYVGGGSSCEYLSYPGQQLVIEATTGELEDEKPEDKKCPWCGIIRKD